MLSSKLRLGLCKANGLLKSTSMRQCSSIKEKNIGLIGVGMVGNAVCKNLLRKGYQISSIYDVDEAKYKDLDAGLVKANNPREVTEGCDIVITALPMPPHVRACCEGDKGLLAGLKKGQVWIDHSTTDYEQTQYFAAEVAKVGAEMLEAPITGGMEALQKGQMTVLMAGDKKLADKLTPLMECSYQSVLYTGELGTALIPKVFSNILCAINCIAMGEIFMIAKKAGLDLPTFWHAVRSSSGNSFTWETAGPGIFRGDYDPTFSVALHCKDYQLGFDIAKKYKVPIELLALGQQIYNKSRYQYGDDAPCYIAPKMLEDALDEPLQVEGFKDWQYSIEDVDGSSVIRHFNIDLKKTKKE